MLQDACFLSCFVHVIQYDGAINCISGHFVVAMIDGTLPERRSLILQRVTGHIM